VGWLPSGVKGETVGRGVGADVREQPGPRSKLSLYMSLVRPVRTEREIRIRPGREETVMLTPRAGLYQRVSAAWWLRIYSAIVVIQTMSERRVAAMRRMPNRGFTGWDCSGWAACSLRRAGIGVVNLRGVALRASGRGRRQRG
jgi:hypothetical protein